MSWRASQLVELPCSANVECAVPIDRILWPEDRIQHIARHAVTPEEFEEVCFGRPLVLRARSEGPNPIYHLLGQTEAGRFLLCVVIHFPDGRGYPVTSRTMSDRERRRYEQWSSRR